MAYNRAMEEFILRGGRYPTESSVRRRARQSAAEENDDYYPPNVSSDKETLSDDPALDYESDEYDDWFVR